MGRQEMARWSRLMCPRIAWSSRLGKPWRSRPVASLKPYLMLSSHTRRGSQGNPSSQETRWPFSLTLPKDSVLISLRRGQNLSSSSVTPPKVSWPLNLLEGGSREIPMEISTLEVSLTTSNQGKIRCRLAPERISLFLTNTLIYITLLWLHSLIH